MTTTTTSAHALPAPTRTHTADEPWPTNLKLLLFVLVGFCATIGVVLYLAAQMPR
jgi:hypothetical protein